MPPRRLEGQQGENKAAATRRRLLDLVAAYDDAVADGPAPTAALFDAIRSLLEAIIGEKMRGAVRMGGAEVVEDAVHDCVEALIAPGTEKGRAFRAIATFADARAIDHYRKWKRRQAYHDPTPDSVIDPAAPAPFGSFEEVALRRASIAKHLDRLPQGAMRQAVVLSLHQRTPEEIARELKYEKSSVYKWLKRFAGMLNQGEVPHVER